MLMNLKTLILMMITNKSCSSSFFFCPIDLIIHTKLAIWGKLQINHSIGKNNTLGVVGVFKDSELVLNFKPFSYVDITQSGNSLFLIGKCFLVSKITLLYPNNPRFIASCSLN